MSHSFFNMYNFGVFTERDNINMIPNTYVSKINKITGNSNVESKVKPPQQVDQLWSRYWDQLILDPLSCNSSWIKSKLWVSSKSIQNTKFGFKSILIIFYVTEKGSNQWSAQLWSDPWLDHVFFYRAHMLVRLVRLKTICYRTMKSGPWHE